MVFGKHLQTVKVRTFSVVVKIWRELVFKTTVHQIPVKMRDCASVDLQTIPVSVQVTILDTIVILWLQQQRQQQQQYKLQKSH